MLCCRLISEKTVEENILKKANQKRMLGDVAIEGGNFTTAFFKQVCVATCPSQPLLVQVHKFLEKTSKFPITCRLSKIMIMVELFYNFILSITSSTFGSHFPCLCYTSLSISLLVHLPFFLEHALASCPYHFSLFFVVFFATDLQMNTVSIIIIIFLPMAQNQNTRIVHN